MKQDTRNKADIIPALKEIAKLKGIDEEMLFTTLEDALTAAYKKGDGTSAQDVRTVVNRESGDIAIFNRKNVVEEVMDDDIEISLEDAKEIDKNYQIGDVVEHNVTPKDFMRVAAQSAKQIVTQRIKEAERAIIYDEFSEKEFDLISGIIQRIDKGNVYVDLGKIEAILGPSEQIPGEVYKFNERIQLYIVEVKQNTKGPLVQVSRTHPGLVRRLFEKEVPEIFDGTVEIKSISREPGSRTKIAVYSRDENVDAIGASVGARRQRISNIVEELNNEKIDIIEWSKEPKEYIANSLNPAKVIAVYIDETQNSAKVVVDSNQLSLAIGKEGQNVRLAAKLTGWKIDIKSEKDAESLDLHDILASDVKESEETVEVTTEELVAESDESTENNNEATETDKAEDSDKSAEDDKKDKDDKEDLGVSEDNKSEEKSADDEFYFTGSIEDMFIDPDFEVEEQEGLVEEVEEVKVHKKDKKKKKNQESEEDFDDFDDFELEKKKSKKGKSRKSKAFDEEF